MKWLAAFCVRLMINSTLAAVVAPLVVMTATMAVKAWRFDQNFGELWYQSHTLLHTLMMAGIGIFALLTPVLEYWLWRERKKTELAEYEYFAGHAVGFKEAERMWRDAAEAHWRQSEVTVDENLDRPAFELPEEKKEEESYW